LAFQNSAAALLTLKEITTPPQN